MIFFFIASWTGDFFGEFTENFIPVFFFFIISLSNHYMESVKIYLYDCILNRSPWRLNERFKLTLDF